MVKRLTQATSEYPPAPLPRPPHLPTPLLPNALYRQNCSVFRRPAARSLPPRPRRRNRSGCVGAATNAPAVTRRSSTHENPRAAAVTNADFPRVLNGPAPGFAEDALRRLLIGSLPGEGGSLTEIGYGKVASGRASVGAAARGGIGCGAGGGGGGGSSGAVFPRVFHDEGVSSSSSPLSSSLSFEPSGAGGALDAAGDAARDAAGETADDAAAAAAAAARHLEASRRTLGWRTGGDRRAEGLSGAERLHGGASLLREDEEEEEGSLDEGQQASLQSLVPEDRDFGPGTGDVYLMLFRDRILAPLSRSGHSRYCAVAESMENHGYHPRKKR